VQAQARVVEPFGERDGGAPVAIVKVAAEAEHLDGFKAVGSDFNEVIAIEAIGDVKMCGDPEIHNQASSSPCNRLNRGYFARFAFTYASVRGMY
jgi:hypothetical protein